MEQERGAITGVGVASPLGTGYRAWVDGIRARRAAGGPLTIFEDRPGLPVGEVRGFHLEDHITTVKSYIDRTSALALACCAMARQHAGWQLSPEQEFQSGLSLGSAWGCMDSNLLYADKLVKSGPKLVPPLVFIHAYANAPNSIISIEYAIRGFNSCFAGGHACGLQAVAYGVDQIRLGRCRYLLAGGVDSLSRAALRGYLTEGILGSECRPFDPASRGFLLSEGSGVVAIEPVSDAGRRALGIVAGAALGRDSGDGEGFARVLRSALGEASMDPGEVDVIVPAACGMPSWDRAEAAALSRVFHGLPHLPALFPVKALTGETMAAGGPLGLIAALGVLSGELDPRWDWHGPSPFGTPAAPLSAPSRPPAAALVHSVSLSGEVCSIVLRRP